MIYLPVNVGGEGRNTACQIEFDVIAVCYTPLYLYLLGPTLPMCKPALTQKHPLPGPCLFLSTGLSSWNGVFEFSLVYDQARGGGNSMEQKEGRETRENE